MKKSLFQILDNEDCYLETSPLDLKTAQLNQIDSIALLFNLLLYFFEQLLMYLPVMLPL